MRFDCCKDGNGPQFAKKNNTAKRTSDDQSKNRFTYTIVKDPSVGLDGTQEHGVAIVMLSNSNYVPFSSVTFFSPVG